MGETTAFVDLDGGNAGLILAQDAALSAPGTLLTLSMDFPAVAGNVRLGLYDSTGPGGGPGNIIVQTAAFAPKVGWNTVSVSPTSLMAGTYWLAYTPSNNALSFPVERSVGTGVWAARAFGAMPAKFPALNGSATVHWSIYATLSVP
jgi:hypothetical protein